MMHVLDDVALISGPSARSRAYAQRMVAAGLIPRVILYQPGEEWQWQGDEVFEVDVCGDGKPFEFRPNETVRQTLASAEVESHELPSIPIDTPDNLAFYSQLSTQVLIFSGYGTGILHPAAFEIDARFLHVHGGYIPDYRGSTTFYYSILAEGLMGASAIWMDPGIDTGPVLLRRRFPVPDGTNIDYISDPLIRATTLVEVLDHRAVSGLWPKAEPVPIDAGETFHKVHPVLKHLALARVGLEAASAS